MTFQPPTAQGGDLPDWLQGYQGYNNQQPSQGQGPGSSLRPGSSPMNQMSGIAQWKQGIGKMMEGGMSFNQATQLAMPNSGWQGIQFAMEDQLKREGLVDEQNTRKRNLFGAYDDYDQRLAQFGTDSAQKLEETANKWADKTEAQGQKHLLNTQDFTKDAQGRFDKYADEAMRLGEETKTGYDENTDATNAARAAADYRAGESEAQMTLNNAQATGDPASIAAAEDNIRRQKQRRGEVLSQGFERTFERQNEYRASIGKWRAQMTAALGGQQGQLSSAMGNLEANAGQVQLQATQAAGQMAMLGVSQATQQINTVEQMRLQGMNSMATALANLPPQMAPRFNFWMQSMQALKIGGNRSYVNYGAIGQGQNPMEAAPQQMA